MFACLILIPHLGAQLNRRLIKLLGQVPAGSALARSEVSAEWEKIDLPIDPTIVLLDVGFTETDPKRGKLLSDSLSRFVSQQHLFLSCLLSSEKAAMNQFSNHRSLA